MFHRSFCSESHYTFVCHNVSDVSDSADMTFFSIIFNEYVRKNNYLCKLNQKE